MREREREMSMRTREDGRAEAKGAGVRVIAGEDDEEVVGEGGVAGGLGTVAGDVKRKETDLGYLLDYSCTCDLYPTL